MNFVLKTERLLLRPFQFTDAETLFALDSNPNVHLYLGNNPVTSIEQCYVTIENVLNQYLKNSIGRFVIELLDNQEVVGWAGIKLVAEEENQHVNFYDLGYRLQEKYWNKGYASEAAKAWLDYAFQKMKIPTLYAIAHIENVGSNKIIQKLGFQQKNQYSHHGIPCYWYELNNTTLSK